MINQYPCIVSFSYYDERSRCIVVKWIQLHVYQLPHWRCLHNQQTWMYFFSRKTWSWNCSWKWFPLLSNGDGNCRTGGINNYPAAVELESRVNTYMSENDREIAIGWITFIVHWSKQKDNIMWILSATINPKPDFIPTHLNYTYCLAMGPSKEEHTKVINHCIKQMEKIMLGEKIFWSEEENYQHCFWIADLYSQQSRTAINCAYTEGR